MTSQRCVLHAAGVLLLTTIRILPAYAQVDSALGLLPLRVGNVWEYAHYYGQYGFELFTGYVDRWIAKDTTIGNNTYWILYFGRYPSIINGRDILRVDSVTSLVYRDARVEDSLRSSVGDYRYSHCVKCEQATVLGVVTQEKMFVNEGESSSSRTYAFGLGIAGYASRWPTSGPDVGTVDRLVYARIDGKEYGTYVSVSEPITARQLVFSVEQNFPNPFNPSTTIRYGLPNRLHVALTVFNTLGQEVALLQNGEQEAGYYQVQFDGSGLSSGVYFYGIHAGEFISTKSMLIVK